MKRFLLTAATVISLASPGVLAQTPYLFWLDETGLLHRMDLDTRQTEAVFQIQPSQFDHKFIDLAIDSESGHIYWAKYSEKTPPDGWYLLRSDLSVTHTDTVYSSASASPPSNGVCVSPHQLAVDITNNKFYWTFSIWGPDGVCQADLTTGNTEQIIPAGNTVGIAIDPEGGKVYFSKPQGMIIRCNLDGSEPDTLATDVLLAEGVFELDVAFDTRNDKVYWAADDAVWRAGLDGSDAEIVVNRDFYWLTIDARSESVFMSDSTGIYRSDLDGGGLERIVEHSWPGHLALYRPSQGTAVERGYGTPATVDLSQNYPNPFNPTTTIPYVLPRSADVALTVVDVLGRQIRELASGPEPPGTYAVSFDASGLSPASTCTVSGRLITSRQKEWWW